MPLTFVRIARLSVLIVLLLTVSGAAGAEAPAEAALDIGDGNSVELVTVPAGKFEMGAVEAVPESPMVGIAIMASGGGLVVALVLFILGRSMLTRERPRFSLGALLVGVLALGAGGVGAMRYRAALRDQSSTVALAYERPRHPVTITRPFMMGRFCVTQQQFDHVMKANFSFFRDPDKPVENVSWNEAAAFCSRVSSLTQKTVRLPTEAEWEYACRAGSTARFSFGDSEKELFKYAWYAETSKDSTHTTADSVKSLKPNAFGLYDMHGNVLEWCGDWFSEHYYANSPPLDPPGAATGSLRVIRGSAWLDPADRCRASTRNALKPDHRGYSLGFRIVVEK